MNQTDIKTNLSRIADDLLDLAEAVGEADEQISRDLRKASYLVEGCRHDLTAEAVGELVNAAAHQHGMVGPTGSEVLRRRRAELCR